MTHHLLPLVAAVSLLPLTACSGAPDAPPPPAFKEGGLRARYFELRSISKDEAAQLNKAFAACAAVELERTWWFGNPPGKWKGRVQGRELEAVRARLLAVPQWYAEHMVKPANLDPAVSCRLRLYDAQGGLLLDSESHPLLWRLYCADGNGSAQSIYAIFPWPSRPPRKTP